MGNNPDTAESVLCPESELNGLLLSVLKDSFSYFTFFLLLIFMFIWGCGGMVISPSFQGCR